MKKYIRVQSEKDIDVTEGLQAIDMTNKDAAVADRLRVAGAWIQTRIPIRKGAHDYPAVIQNWPSVKSLVNCGVITLGVESDETTEEKAVEMYERYYREKQKYLDRAAAAKADAIAGVRTVKGKTVKKTVEVETTETGDIIEG